MRPVSQRTFISLAFLFLVVSPHRAIAGSEGLLYPFPASASSGSLYSAKSDQRLEPTSRTVRDTFGRFAPDSKEIFRSILPWRWKNYLPAVLIMAGTIPLALAKDEIQRNVDLSSGDDLPYVRAEAFYSRFEFLGDNETLPAVTLAFLLGGVAAGSQREVETGLMLAQSLFFTVLATGLGQLVLAEDRPYEGGDFRFFRMHGHGVSGHSSVAASMVKPMESQYLSIREDDGTAEVVMKYAGKVCLHAAPIMVGVTRVRSNKHYVWNVVLGLSTGYSAGKVVADLHRRSGKEERYETKSWRLVPLPDGLSFCLDW